MKAALVFLALVPIVFSAPQKRLILDTLGLDLEVIKTTVQHVVDTLGTDGTEQQCEAVCHGLILGDETALLHTFCTPICRSIQTLAHTLHIAPSTAAKRALLSETVQKRFFFDTLGLDVDAIKATVQHVVDTLGTDATEQQCEAVCHGFVPGDESALLHTFCTPICRSVQTLAHTFHIAPSTTAKRALLSETVQKRFFLDTLGLDIDAIKATVQHVVDTLGTDATEQQCEAVCHAFVLGDESALLHTFCTPICRSVQTLAQTLNIAPSTAAKRALLGDLINLDVVKEAVGKLVGTLGTDATEQQCETACHALVLGDETALLQTLCTPICRSFQALVQRFGPTKRFFLDDFLDLSVVRKAVGVLASTLGTDATEQQCEAGCHGLVLGDETALLHTFCTPICRSFQELAHFFEVKPSAATPAKRFFLTDIGLDLDSIKATVQHVLDTVGTDETEQLCESSCHSFVLGDEGALLHTFCTPVCRSFQSLVHIFHLAPSTATQSTAATPA